MNTTRSNRITAALIAAAALALGSATAATAAPAIPLNNGQETTGANTGAHGFFSYDITGTELCYVMSVDRLSAPAVAAHIHIGDRRVAGPVVVPLEVGSGTSWTVDDCVTISATLAAAIESDPRNYYVNVHTPAFPGGEVRGQLK